MRGIAGYVEARWEHFKLCWENAKDHRGISLFLILFAIYEVAASLVPFVEVPNVSVPKVSLPWAGTIFLAVTLYMVIEGGYRLRQDEVVSTATGLIGDADLMLQELDLSDLKITDDGATYETNLAAFLRMEVASLDKPRTVKRFEIEMLAPDGTLYRANSEYEVGDYDYHHEVSKSDSWGMATVERVREPMDDLAARVRIPIQPNTHVPRAWVRFEMPKVKQGHEPKNCTIRILAIDPSEQRHEIITDAMQVKAIDDTHEYAIARKQ